MAVETTYREVARVLSEWTAVQLSHTTVGSIVRRVGKTQAQADKKLLEELEEATSLPQGKQIDYLFVEADGVFVRSMEKKSHEVRHAVMYEGWEKNGKRVSLREPKVIMTTKPIAEFWKEVQAFSTHQYS